MARFLIACAVLMPFLGAGVACTFWPSKIQAWAVGSSERKKSLIPGYPPIDYIKSKAYLRELRTIGVILLVFTCVIAGLFLFSVPA